MGHKNEGWTMLKFRATEGRYCTLWQSMLLSLLQFVASSSSSHTSVQQLAFQRNPWDWEIAIKQAEHLAWFSFLLNSTLELIQQNNNTSLSWHGIYLVRNQFWRSVIIQLVTKRIPSFAVKLKNKKKWKVSRYMWYQPLKKTDSSP